MVTLNLKVKIVSEASVKEWKPPKHLFVITTPDNRCVVADLDSLFSWLQDNKVNDLVAQKIADLAIKGYEVRYDGEEGSLTGKISLPVKWEYP